MVIRGYGLVSALGVSAWETFRALLDGRTIAQRTSGLLPETDLVSLVQATGGISCARVIATDPAVELAERAAREALSMAKLDAGSTAPDRAFDLILGTSKGAVHALSAAAEKLLTASPRGRPKPIQKTCELAVALGPHGYLTHQLRTRLGMTSPAHGERHVSHIVASCTSGLAALHIAANRLRSLAHKGETGRILVVTSEAALLPLFIHSYSRLGVLAGANCDNYVGRPLDQARSGFMPAEMAAAVVIETTNESEPGNIELLDTALMSDTHDMVRSSKTMSALVNIANRLFSHCPLDAIHPHATGTTDHDPAEIAALENALAKLPPALPQVYASKGAIGHGLGASGLASLVIACMCATARRLPPMPWLNKPIDSPLLHDSSARASTNNARDALACHAIFAAGFGGPVAGALIKRL